MTQLTDEEIKLTAEQGIHVVHCPESNLKLASGHCPVDALLKAGTNVCLGTDSASSNNDLDMIGEMRTASLIAKTTANNATQPVYDPIATIVYSATRDQVSDVWVAGKARVRNKKLIDVDTSQLLQKTANWNQRILND